MPKSPSHSPTSSHSRGAHRGGGSDEGSGGGGGGGGGGKLIKVAFARNQPEAEMIQGLLRESGIQSVLKRSRGFDAPEFLSAGPHDVFVNSDLATKATELLADTMLESEGEERAELAGEMRRIRGGGETSPARLALYVTAAALFAFALVWVLYQLS